MFVNMFHQYPSIYRVKSFGNIQLGTIIVPKFRLNIDNIHQHPSIIKYHQVSKFRLKHQGNFHHAQGSKATPQPRRHVAVAARLSFPRRRGRRGRRGCGASPNFRSCVDLDDDPGCIDHQQIDHDRSIV